MLCSREVAERCEKGWRSLIIKMERPQLVNYELDLGLGRTLLIRIVFALVEQFVICNFSEEL